MKKYDPLGLNGNGVGVDTLPTPVARVDTGGLKFFDCKSRITPEWLNAIQEEMANVIEGAGLTLDGADLTQLLQAIQAFADAAQAAAEATAAAALAGAVEIRIPVQGTPNGTALGAGATLIGTAELVLPANREWTWVEGVFSAQILSAGAIGFEKVEVDGNVQSWIGLKHNVATQNDDDHMIVDFDFKGVPSVIDQDITIDFFANNGASGGDSTAERQMYVIGYHVAV